MVKVLLYGHALREAVEEPEFEVELDAPSTVRQLLESNAEKVGPVLSLADKGEVLVTVNRKVGDLRSAVRDGDTVKLTHNYNPTFEGAMWQNP